ncbi:MAG: F0F1 ATP synthase subunit gamma [Actinomycetaceae bacterium]|nr:F0F1 ATP synthase subunit gamma [Actinomycetaceae bacterium]
MAGAQRIFKEKIRATSTLEKVFRAMELIAASRIAKAREAAEGLDPYTRALTQSIAAVALHDSESDHPMLTQRTDTNKVAVLVVTSDRGMAGAYSSSVLREADRVLAQLREEGKEPLLYVSGRRGQSYYRFRGVDVVQSWSGQSDKPSEEMSDEIAEVLLDRYLAPAEEGGIASLIVVHTRFVSMVSQVVQVRHMLPLEVVEPEEDEDRAALPVDELGDPVAAARPLFDFEPSAEEIFDTLLPMYVSQRIRSVLLMAAASELASRQQAMHSATENAQKLIEDYTRMANNARQAEITTEITEIVSGADALKQDA